MPWFESQQARSENCNSNGTAPERRLLPNSLRVKVSERALIVDFTPHSFPRGTGQDLFAVGRELTPPEGSPVSRQFEREREGGVDLTFRKYRLFI